MTGPETVNMVHGLHVGYDWLAGVKMVRGDLACLVWHGARLLIRTVGGDMELGARES